MANELFTYPDPLPWSHRAAAMPWFPGGNDGQLGALRAILNAAKSGATDDITVALDDDSSVGIVLRTAGLRVQPTGLIKRADHGRWTISDEADAWLTSGDGCLLIAILHSRVRFVGELLKLLQESPQTHANLNSAASSLFGIEWSTLDQIRRRTVWLRSTGVVDLRFDNALCLTKVGESLLTRLRLADPFLEREQLVEMSTAPDPAEWVTTALTSSAKSLPSRKPVIGYIPGAADNAIETLRRLVTAASPSTTRTQFDTFCDTEYAIKTSSTAASLTTLRGAGLIEQVSAETFAPTPQALEWLSDGNDLDFALWLHTRFLFFLEVIPSLETASRPRELAAVAKTSYGFPREDVEEMRRRLQLLRCAGVVTEISSGGDRATGMGLAIASHAPLQRAGVSGVTKDALIATQAIAESSDTESLLTQLRLAARDSAHPDQLEKAVARAIRLLGFRTEWLGGPGRTDVVATAAHGDGSTVVIDAKSTASGAVTEGQINFDTLREHKVQHGAECIAVVGAAFTGDRLAKRAQQHGVVLIDIDQLEAIVRGHLHAPLPTSDYAAFFRQTGIASLEGLERAWAAQRRLARLLTAVLQRLNAEAESADPITQGALSSQELYLVLRSEMEAPPTPDELKGLLNFLAAEPMRCIKTIGGRYSLVEDPSTTARRMRIYATAAAAAHND